MLHYQCHPKVSKQLFKSTFIVSAMTTISRIFGLLRDTVIAHIFSASVSSDAFFVAFKIPNFLRQIFAEGGFSKAFIPLLTEYKHRGNDANIQDFLDHTSGKLILALLCVSVIGVIAAPILIIIFAPGFMNEANKLALSTQMLRITFPYILLISLTAFAGSILNTYGRFAIPAFTPVLLNISLIACTIWLAPMLAQPVMALAWGVLIAGIIQLLFQLPFLTAIRRLPRPRLKKNHQGVQRILKLMVPTLFATSIAQINLIVDTLMASFLVTGSISWLYYSERLMLFPVGVFGIALATVILPNLSAEYIKDIGGQFSELLDWALRLVLLISVPSAVGLALFAEPILMTIFQHGEFDFHDVAMSGRSLLAYAVGLPGIILVQVLTNGYFSRQDTKTPVKIGVTVMVTNIILNCILIGPLAHAGLALATSLAVYLNAGLLFYFLSKRNIYTAQSGWCLFITRIVFAVSVMFALLYLLAPPNPVWRPWDLSTRILQLGGWITAGCCIYLVILRLSGLCLSSILLTAKKT